ncbi:MAG: alpha/beta fold hydrolase [Bacteroidota bacterium]
MNLKIVLRLLLILIGLYVLSVVLVYALQKYYIFRPQVLKTNHQYQFDYPFEEFYLTTEDSVRLNALYFAGQGVKKGAVLYCHGNSDNLQRWGRYHPDFTGRGYDVLIFDYRGYGKSGGPVGDEAAFYQDARSAYQWLRQRYQPEEIILYGRSLGTAPASRLATELPARLLLLETPFDNIRGAIGSRLPEFMMPFSFSYRFPNDEHLQAINCPVYILQGTADRIVPYQSALRLKPHLKPKDDFFTIEGGKHRNLSSFESYQQQLDVLLGINEFKSER